MWNQLIQKWAMMTDKSKLAVINEHAVGHVYGGYTFTSGEQKLRCIFEIAADLLVIAVPDSRPQVNTSNPVCLDPDNI